MSAGTLYRRLAALTPEQRARFTRRLEADGLADPDAEIVRRSCDAGPLPASLMQQRLWLLDQMEPGNPFYNLPLLGFRLEGRLDRRALGAAWAEIARRHEALRTTFAALDGAPVQVVAPPAPPAAPSPLSLADLAAVPAPARPAAARAVALAEARRPFDLARGPLWRTALLRLDAEDHLLLVTMHHIVSDAWSIRVLYGELAALYGAFRQGRPSPLSELPVQYPDFALWQRRRLSGPLLAAEIAFWRGQLAGAPERLELPTDRPRPSGRSYRGRRRTLALPAELPAALAGLAQAAGASLFMVLLAGLDALLHRLTGQDDLVLGSPVAGRNHVGTEGLIGFFVNTVVIRIRLAGELTLGQLVGRVREVVLDVYEHQELPFDRLVEEIQPRRNAAYGPVFQAMFSLQNVATPDFALDGLAITPQWIDNGTAQTDLILFAGAQRGSLDVLQLEYSTDLFDDATIARLEGHLLTLLAAAAAAPETRLADLPLLSAAERQQLAEWSGPRRPAPAAAAGSELRLDRRFAAQAARRPERIAVELGSASLTYGELARRAGRLAARLRRNGVGAEVPVGLCLERTLDLPVAILGALAAGGAYLPLDPESPPERLRFILEDARAPVVVTTRELARRLGETPARLVLLDDGTEEEADDDGRDFVPSVDGALADAAAYVIYTSGSTGRPKGVLVSHRAVLRLFAATAELLPAGPEDVWTVFHSYAFDFAVWELWGALLHGGRAVLLPAAVARFPEELLAVLRERRATVLSQTPSAFRGLAAALPAAGDLALGTAGDLALRAVVFGGEALHPEDLRPWLARAGDGGPRLLNMYGITETTVHATCRPMAPADLARPGSPIGFPLADLALHLLDRAGNPVPIGVAGEICVGGAGVARGYLGRPELTAERFVPDPFAEAAAAGGRLYRSGDLGRRRPDGDVEYLGRIDLQVKVRGVRIELGEIEAALARHPGVAAAAVAAREIAPGEVGLVAYCVPAGREPATADLRAFLRATLPEVMVPAAFVALAALPLTVNGKLDRRALPAPDRLRRSGEDYREASTPLEETLAIVWRDLLGVDRVGVRDDFFELGGHSLLATRLASRLRDRLDVELSAQLVFQTPTVAGMAVELERLIAAAAQAAADGVVVPRAPALVPVARRARRGGSGR
jgi:amino acid adenylation domain-containing protein